MLFNRILVASLVLGAAFMANAQKATVTSSFTNICVSATNMVVDRAKLKTLVDTLLLESPALQPTSMFFIGNCTCAGYATIKAPHALASSFANGPVAIFTTGFASQAVVNQNTKDGYTGTFKGLGGDPELTALVAANWNPDYDSAPSTKEACGVKFTAQVLPHVRRNANVHFQYVFASEEYPDYVNSAKNDVFAFYVNTSDLPKTNIATVNVEGTPQLVGIHTINEFVNPGKFNMNYFGADQPLAIEYNGYTNALDTASFAISGGEKIDFKLVIADVDDNRLDSAVYIRAPIAVCGDGVKQADEECDDGNNVDTDACTNACRRPRCGDGIVSPGNGEQCEKSLLSEDQQCSCSRWCQNLPHGCGDPHILTFDGADFMFNGWADATFNMLTHASYQINTYFRKYPKQDPTKTWIGAIGVKVGGSDKIEITGTGKGSMAVKVNGETLSLNSNIEHPAYTLEYTGDEDGGKEVMLTTPDIVIGVSIDPENWNLDFEVERIAEDMGPMHGILGQSYGRMMEQKDDVAHGRTPDAPVNGVQGTDADYNVPSGLFGDDFKYNLFTGASVKLGASRAVAVTTTTSSSRKLQSTRAGYF